MRIAASGNRRKLLEEWGIIPPPFRKQSGKLVRYVLLAGSGGGEKEKRIKMIKNTHEEWVGKRVKDRFSRKVGRVLCLNVKSVAEIRREKIMDSSEVCYLNALVLWGNGVKETRNFVSLVIIEE